MKNDIESILDTNNVSYVSGGSLYTVMKVK